MEKSTSTLFFIFFFFLQVCAAMAQKQESANTYWRQAQTAEQKENYQQALELYKKCKRSTTDKYFKEDCEKKIEYLKQIVVTPYLTVPEQVKMSYNGGYEEVTINSYPAEWEAEVVSGQIQELKRNGNQLLIVTLPNNSKLETQTSVIKVTSGKLSKKINVVQDASPEVLHCSSEEISPSSKGDHYLIDITTNYDNWSVVADSTWFRITQEGKRLRIDVDPNDSPESRKGSLTIVGKDKTLLINIHQHSGDEMLSFSHNNLYFSPDRESRTIGVHTNAENWYLGNSPDWCIVERVARDSVRITTVRNTSDNIPREASVSINTGLQTQSIRIYQDARPYVPEYVFKKILMGRNVSFGISASLNAPLMMTSSSGSYTGSVINYSIGNAAENASYKTTVGFSVGAFADFRLYKNTYLNVGVNFSSLQYENTFLGQNERHILPTGSSVLVGDFINSFKEKYSLKMIDVPVLFSQRFVLTDRSNIHVNIGPVFYYGLSAKMDLSGNSESEEVYTCLVQNDQIGPIIGQKTGIHERYLGNMNLYDKVLDWTTTSSIGVNVPIKYTYKANYVPLNRINYGIKAGIIYELAGIQFGLTYSQMISNMANEDFWNSNRIKIFPNNGETLMSGYMQKFHLFQLSVAYVFRY